MQLASRYMRLLPIHVDSLWKSMRLMHRNKTQNSISVVWCLILLCHWSKSMDLKNTVKYIVKEQIINGYTPYKCIKDAI